MASGNREMNLVAITFSISERNGLTRDLTATHCSLVMSNTDRATGDWFETRPIPTTVNCFLI